MKNAGEALQRVLQCHPAALRVAAQAHAAVTQPVPVMEPALVAPPVSESIPVAVAPQPDPTDREQRFRTVLELHAQGRNIVARFVKTPESRFSDSALLSS